MTVSARPVRFLAIVGALWIGGRVWWLLPQDVRDAPLRPESGRAAARSPSGRQPSTEPFIAPSSAVMAIGAELPPMAASDGAAIPPSPLSVATTMIGAHSAVPPVSPPLPIPLGRPSTPPISGTGARDAALPLIGPSDPPSPSRWSGNAYLFARNGGGNALAAGGQLGGGQAGARIAWRVNRDGPARIALAARAYVPLDDGAAAEVAAGVDIHPLPGQPLRLSVERRFDAGGKGRSAWSAYAAGGFWREIGRGVELDGYAQAGVVGLHSGDLFGDGALRLAARRELGDGVALRLGGGAWAGAQPDVARLDIGPRVALGLPLGRANVTAAIEGRFRVAGEAAPGSGVALTLATDF